jgi:hypothetical protein
MSSDLLASPVVVAVVHTSPWLIVSIVISRVLVVLAKRDKLSLTPIVKALADTIAIPAQLLGLLTAAHAQRLRRLRAFHDLELERMRSTMRGPSASPRASGPDDPDPPDRPPPAIDSQVAVIDLHAYRERCRPGQAPTLDNPARDARRQAT